MKKQITILLDEDRVAIAGPILIELIQGTRNEEEKEKVNEYVKGLHWLPVTDDHWHQSADFAFKLRRKGITSSAIDVLIATLAIDYLCSLLHKDSDFDQISRHSSLVCYRR
jgi:predicted nucleic acid-binding protein